VHSRTRVRQFLRRNLSYHSASSSGTTARHAFLFFQLFRPCRASLRLHAPRSRARPEIRSNWLHCAARAGQGRWRLRPGAAGLGSTSPDLVASSGPSAVFFGAGADFLASCAARGRAVFRGGAAFLAGFFAEALRAPARARGERPSSRSFSSSLPLSSSLRPGEPEARSYNWASVESRQRACRDRGRVRRSADRNPTARPHRRGARAWRNGRRRTGSRTLWNGAPGASLGIRRGGATTPASGYPGQPDACGRGRDTPRPGGPFSPRLRRRNDRRRSRRGHD
jgi:hypothetical protein